MPTSKQVKDKEAEDAKEKEKASLQRLFAAKKEAAETVNKPMANYVIGLEEQIRSKTTDLAEARKALEDARKDAEKHAATREELKQR